MTIHAVIPADYPADSFDAQRSLLDRNGVELAIRDDGARVLTFPEGTIVTRFPDYDMVRLPMLPDDRFSMGHRITFDKGMIPPETTDQEDAP